MKLASTNLTIESSGATADEAAALEVGEGTPLARVSRVLLIEGKPAAWMVDVVPQSIVGVHEVVMVGPEDGVGEKLGLKASSAALSLIQTMYLTDGHPAQWSRDTFLPGKLNLHVVRELFEVRNLPQ